MNQQFLTELPPSQPRPDSASGASDLRSPSTLPRKTVAEFVVVIGTASIDVLKADLLDRMKSHICELVEQGTIPTTVASFGDIDNFYDANDIGDLCNDEICDALITRFGGRNEHEGMPDDMHVFISVAQDSVDTWMKASRS